MQSRSKCRIAIVLPSIILIFLTGLLIIPAILAFQHFRENQLTAIDTEMICRKALRCCYPVRHLTMTGRCSGSTTRPLWLHRPCLRPPGIKPFVRDPRDMDNPDRLAASRR